jgi:hypothetical protein
MEKEAVVELCESTIDRRDIWWRELRGQEVVARLTLGYVWRFFNLGLEVRRWLRSDGWDHLARLSFTKIVCFRVREVLEILVYPFSGFVISGPHSVCGWSDATFHVHCVILGLGLQLRVRWLAILS